MKTILSERISYRRQFCRSEFLTKIILSQRISDEDHFVEDNFDKDNFVGENFGKDPDRRGQFMTKTMAEEVNL